MLTSLNNTIEERIAPALRFSPETCSLNMGSMNFSFPPLATRYDTWKFDWERTYVAKSDSYIFRNTFADIENAATQLSTHGIKFEHECDDVGHLYNLRFCMDIGLFKAPVFIQFIFGILGGIGPEPDNLTFMKHTADRLFGDDCRWSVLGAGGAQMSLTTTASQMAATSALGWSTASSFPAASWPGLMPNRSARSAGSLRIWAARSLPPTRRARYSA